MEKEASRWTAREVDVHVGGWHLLGCQSDDGGGHRGKSKRRVADENCSKNIRQREMESKQFGNGRGCPVAQKRGRPKDGLRTSQERSGGDGQGVQRKVGGRRACPSPEASVHFTLEFGGIWIHNEVSGVHVVLRGTSRQAHTENYRRRMKEELKGTAKAHVATRRMKEYQDRAAERGTKRTNTDQEEGRQQREHGESVAGMEEDAPTSSSSGSGDGAPTQSANKKRKAEEEHLEDPECDDGKWMRTHESKRKDGEESEESRLRQTVKYLKELDKKESGGGG